MHVDRYPYSESSILELKRALPKNGQIIKTLIGFCNLHGGKLVIGVGDDLSIIGLTDKEIEDCLEWIEKSVHEASFPPIIPRVSIQCIGDKNLLEIEVSSGMNKPYYRKAEGIEKGTYIRLGRNTIRATLEMIEELRWQTAGKHFEKLPVFRSTLEDLDKKAFDIFLKDRRNHGVANFSLPTLKSYDLVEEEHGHVYPTNAGLLLFGKNTQKYLSEAMIICTHFQGTEGRDVVATIDCEGDLFNQFRSALDFLLSRLTHSFSIEEVKRKEQLEVPQKAIREALLNVVVHRNYNLPSPTKISIWSDRIELFSPGGFPGPIDTENLRAGRSYLRNPSICKLFREAGYIEKLGSGLIVMLDSYLLANLPTPQVVDGGDFVKYILPRPSAYRETVKKDDIEAKILTVLDRYTELKTQEIIKLLGVPRATLSRTLTNLVKKGKILRIGQTRSIRYKRKK